MTDPAKLAETDPSLVSVPEQRQKAARDERLALYEVACENRAWRTAHKLAQPNT